MYYRLSGIGTSDRTSIEQAFAAIPADVTILNLGWNNLIFTTGDELTFICAAIPAGVRSVDLGGNGFSNKTGTVLATAFAAIPESVTSLDLACNGLGSKTGAELALAFDGIPKSVKSLDLTANKLDMLKLNDFAQLHGSLLSVETLYLSYYEVIAMGDAKRQALIEALPKHSNTVFLDAAHNTMGVRGIEQLPIIANNSFQSANLARRLKFPATAEVPSLQSFASFFIKERRIPTAGLPENVQQIVKTS